MSAIISRAQWDETTHSVTLRPNSPREPSTSVITSLTKAHRAERCSDAICLQPNPLDSTQCIGCLADSAAHRALVMNKRTDVKDVRSWLFAMVRTPVHLLRRRETHGTNQSKCRFISRVRTSSMRPIGRAHSRHMEDMGHFVRQGFPGASAAERQRNQSRTGLGS
jgi:hypothetical protein